MKDWFTLPAWSSEAIHRHAIKLDDAEEEELPGLFTPGKSFRELMLDLMNVKTREDLADFLGQCGYAAMAGANLQGLRAEAESMRSNQSFLWKPRHITDAVWEHWCEFRDELRASVLLPEYLKKLPGAKRKEFYVRDLVDLESLRFSPDIDEKGGLAVKIEAADPVSAIGLGAAEISLRRVGVRRCKFRRCGRFFPMPEGRGHALLYCPAERREPTAGGYSPKSKCYEKEKKAREQEDRLKRYRRWARAADARWKKLPKSKRDKLSRSKFIAEHAFRISKEKKPPFTGLFVTRYYLAKGRKR